MSDQVEIEVVEGEGVEVVEGILQGEELDRAVKWLQDEHGKASGEMEARNRKILKWRRSMEAVASDAPKNKPMRNSSNVTVPLTQTLTQNQFAKIKGTFDARDPFWTLESPATDARTVERVRVVQDYLNMLAEGPYDLNLEEVKKDLLFETILVGGCFPKVVWSVDSWRVMEPGGGERQVTYHDGPAIVVVPAERVRYRRGVDDIARLEWISLDTPMTESELREMAAKGVFDAGAVASVLDQKRTSPDDMEAGRQQAEWFDQAEQTGLVDVSEFWFYWDVDGSGVPVDLFFTIHVPTGAVFKQQYNTLGARFVVNAKYIHRPFSLLGRGTGQMTEGMQDEATQIHNLANDNMKIANMRMFGIKRQAGMSDMEEIYPGKVFQFDNPREDFTSIGIGEIYPSIQNAEAKSWNIGQKAIGLTDNQMGFADDVLKSRDTARGQAMRLQQGDSIMQSVVEGLRTTFAKLGMLVWMQCVANKESVMAKERAAARMSPKDLDVLQEALDMPLGEVPMRLAFNVKTTDADKTYEMRKQGYLMLAQVYAGYGQQTIPLAMQLFGPQGEQMRTQAPELWKYMCRVLTGSGELMEQVFRFFGLKETGKYIPDNQALQEFLDTLGAVGESFAGAGGLLPAAGGGGLSSAGASAGPGGPGGLPPEGGGGGPPSSALFGSAGAGAGAAGGPSGAPPSGARP